MSINNFFFMANSDSFGKIFLKEVRNTDTGKNCAAANIFFLLIFFPVPIVDLNFKQYWYQPSTIINNYIF